MKRANRSIVFPAVLALLVLAAAGCEDSGLNAPGDGSIVLTANPATAVIDPNAPDPPRDPVTGQLKADVTIVARVFDSAGNAMEKVAVIFSTTGGRLASGGVSGSPVKPVTTDANGIAQDTLTVLENDPEQIEVTAQSGALSQKVTVTKVLTAENAAPTAVIATAPVNEQLAGSPVIFDGSGSFDPDGTITMYRWTITSSNPDPGKDATEVVEDPGAFGLERTYYNVQSLAVTLEVSDDPAAESLLASGMPVPYDDYASQPYEIVCSNPAPVAVISGPSEITITITQGSHIFDGRGSYDQEPNPTPLDDYLWNCGNNYPPQPLFPGDPSQVRCIYNVVGDYTTTLIVRDQGTGQLGPNGNWICQKNSEEDQVLVHVVAPQ